MKRPVHLDQMSGIYGRLDLRRADIGVTEQLLDVTQIRPALEQVCRKAVPQHMRADRPLDARRYRVLLEALEETHARDTGAAMIDEDERFGANHKMSVLDWTGGVRRTKSP